MIDSVIVAGLFLLIGIVVGFILGVGSDDTQYYETITTPKRKSSKRVGTSQGPVETEAKGKPTIHVVTPKTPAQVEFDRQHKKPDLMKPE